MIALRSVKAALVLLLAGCAASSPVDLCMLESAAPPAFAPGSDCAWTPGHAYSGLCRAGADNPVALEFHPFARREKAEIALRRLTTPEGRRELREIGEESALNQNLHRIIAEPESRHIDIHLSGDKEAEALEIERLRRLIAAIDAYYRDLDVPALARWFEKAARNGDPRAQTCLGLMHEFGLGFPESYANAFPFYRSAAAGKHPMAVLRLSNFYGWGKVVKRDRRKQLALLREAASLGQRGAATNNCAIYSEMGSENHELAVNWCKVDANVGHPNAYFFLGMAHRDGHGVPRDYDKAAHWFAKAGAFFQSSRMDFCRMWKAGEGVGKNDPLAREWCAETAK